MRLLTATDLYIGGVLIFMEIAGLVRWRRVTAFAAMAIGTVAYAVSARKRRLSDDGIAHAMGQTLSPRERRAVVKAAFRHFWREVFSLVGSASHDGIAAAAGVRGLPRLTAAMHAGRGVILWESSYFGNRLMAKRILKHHGIAVHQVHAESHLGGFHVGRHRTSILRRRVLRPRFERHELRSLAAIIHVPDEHSLGFTRALHRTLQAGAVLCVSSDGPLGQKFVSAPFLGRRRPFATGVVSLARLSGCTLLPVFCFEASDGRPCLVIEEPLTIDAEQDRDPAIADVVARYARLLESYVRRHPGQYRNWHSLGGHTAAAPSGVSAKSFSV